MFLCFYNINNNNNKAVRLVGLTRCHTVYANSMADKNESFILLEFFYGQNDC